MHYQGVQRDGAGGDPPGPPSPGPAAKAAALIEARKVGALLETPADSGCRGASLTEPQMPTDLSAAWAPKKQQQFDETPAPIDDQERRAVNKRLAARVEDDRRRKGLQTGRSDRSARNTERGGSGSQTPKSTWRARASGYLSSRGLISSRSAGGTARSMLSTSRSMMTTARSDMNTGRYNDFSTSSGKEMMETRTLEIPVRLDVDEGGDGDRRTRAHAHAQGTMRVTGKTPRKTAASTAAALRAGLARRSQGGKSTARKG
jgi:hypothetical protein